MTTNDDANDDGDRRGAWKRRGIIVGGTSSTDARYPRRPPPPATSSSSTRISGLGWTGGQSAGDAASRAARHACTCFAACRAREMLEPPHSLHWVRCLPCSQIPPPPHSLHLLRRVPCSQMLVPPHSLHVLRTLPCSQMPEPPHSLHVFRCLPCSQMLEPRTPCSSFAPSRARRSLPRALLAEVPSLALAVHARLAAPCPPDLARTLPEGWGHGGRRAGL